MAKFRLVAGANEDVLVKTLKLYNNGSTADGDVTNIKLLGPDGVVLGTAAKTATKTVSFDLTKDKDGKAVVAGGYKISKGEQKDLAVRMDVTSGATRTVRWLVQNDYDLEAAGASTLTSIIPAVNAAGNDRTFPVGDTDDGATSTNFINRVTVASGTMTLARSVSSPTGNIAAGGTGVTLGKWELKASGEDMELRTIAYSVTRSAATNLSGTFYLKIGEGTDPKAADLTTIYTVAGSSVTYGALAAAASATLSTYPTLKANTAYTVFAVGDISSSAAAGLTYSANLDVTQVYRKNSGDLVDPTATTTAGNTLTVQLGTLTVSANGSQPAISVVAGQSVVTTLGSWNFTAGPAEGIMINSVTIDDSTAGLGRNFK